MRPVELLGLTATPERSDGLPLLDWFDDRIAAELRLWDAIDQHRLVAVRLLRHPRRARPARRAVAARPRLRRRGLTNLLTAQRRLGAAGRRRARPHASTTRARCARSASASASSTRGSWRACSARRASRRRAIWADTPDDERQRGADAISPRPRQRRLLGRSLQRRRRRPRRRHAALLRPTDSPTLFLQQLGRGLRRAPRQDGLHGARLRRASSHASSASTGASARCSAARRRDLARAGREASRSSRRLPHGARPGRERDRAAQHPRSRAVAVDARRSRSCARWRRRAARVSLASSSRRRASSSRTSTPATNPGRTSAPTPACRSTSRAATRRRSDARAAGSCTSTTTRASRPTDVSLRRGPAGPRDALGASGGCCACWWLGRRQGRDARRRRSQDGLRSALGAPAGARRAARAARRPRRSRRRTSTVRSRRTRRAAPGPRALHAHRDPRGVRRRRGAKVAPWQTGVYWAKEAEADLLAFTLDKTSGQFSPTTRYRDYAISRELIHWESQSVTRADSETGRRYQRTGELGRRKECFIRPINSTPTS